MIEDLPSFKAASIGRCGSRVREEYARAPNTFAADRPAQDAATLNIQRACEAALHIGHHLIRREHLCVPQSACGALVIVPTLLRVHATRHLPRLDAKRPEFGLPRLSVGAIKKGGGLVGIHSGAAGCDGLRIEHPAAQTLRLQCTIKVMSELMAKHHEASASIQ